MMGKRASRETAVSNNRLQGKCSSPMRDRAATPPSSPPLFLSSSLLCFSVPSLVRQQFSLKVMSSQVYVAH